MFGLSKRERTEKELREIQTWIVGRSMVIATTLGGETTQTGESAFNGTDKQFAIAIEACCFFLHALSRIAWRPQGERCEQCAQDNARVLGQHAFVPQAQDPLCTRCGSPMRVRMGKYGSFWGCSRYPACKHTRNISQGRPGPRDAA